MNLSDYAAVQNALLRMVVPMRREFGVALDVPRMRVDIAYARFIVAQALASGSPPLRDSAGLIQRWLDAAAARELELGRSANDSTLPAEESDGDSPSRPTQTWRDALVRMARRVPLRLAP